MRPDIIGLNCATGPREMSEHLRHLSQHVPHAHLVLPNAGLPSVVDGHMHYDLTPDQLAELPRALRHRARRAGRRRLLRHHARAPQRRRRRRARPHAGAHGPVSTSRRRPSIYSPVPFHQDTSFLIIGERTNANGSRSSATRCSTATGTPASRMAGDQVQEGAHVLDVCVDYVGRDGTADMDEIASPLRHPGHRAAGARLHRAPGARGRPAAGSAAGPSSTRPTSRTARRPGSRLDRVITLAKEYGAAVICLLIDERGQARDVEWKMRGRPPHPRPGRRALRPRAERPHLRRAHLPAVHRRRRPAPRRHGHHRGHPAHQGRDPRGVHRARRVQRVVRPQPGGPPRPQLGVPARVRGGRPRRRHRARRPASCRCTGSPTSSARSAST